MFPNTSAKKDSNIEPFSLDFFCIIIYNYTNESNEKGRIFLFAGAQKCSFARFFYLSQLYQKCFRKSSIDFAFLLF